MDAGHPARSATSRVAPEAAERQRQARRRWWPPPPRSVTVRTFPRERSAAGTPPAGSAPARGRHSTPRAQPRSNRSPRHRGAVSASMPIPPPPDACPPAPAPARPRPGPPAPPAAAARRAAGTSSTRRRPPARGSPPRAPPGGAAGTAARGSRAPSPRRRPSAGRGARRSAGPRSPGSGTARRARPAPGAARERRSASGGPCLLAAFGGSVRSRVWGGRAAPVEMVAADSDGRRHGGGHNTGRRQDGCAIGHLSSTPILHAPLSATVTVQNRLEWRAPWTPLSGPSSAPRSRCLWRSGRRSGVYAANSADKAGRWGCSASGWRTSRACSKASVTQSRASG